MNAAIPQLDSTVKAYADHSDDGIVQLSFSLKLPDGPAARRAATELAGKMGLRRPEVVYALGLDASVTFFIVYGECVHAVAVTEVNERDTDGAFKDREEIEAIIAREIGRPLVVVGASTGTDTHSVGIDAIFNMKGYNGHYGLERYKGIEAHNMGSQVSNAALLARARELRADAILVSQTVTQQDLHVQNLSQLMDMVEAEGLRDDLIMICGGPRISSELAKELGFDAGFSRGAYAYHVATFIVGEMLRRRAEARRWR